MRIRDAELQDAGQLDALLSKLIQEEVRYDSNLIPDCVIKANYGSRIGLEGHKLLLIEADGEIAGYVYGFLYQIPGMYKAPIAILDALYVERKHRRKGYATRLIEAFRAFAREQGACRVELKAVSLNQPAVALYQKQSFVETKKYMKLEL